MAARALWKGYLRLSLVSCPIALYPAVSPAERISFRQINKETGNRLRQNSSTMSLARSCNRTTRAVAMRLASVSTFR
jgi:non-homologous end joining protein Ku